MTGEERRSSRPRGRARDRRRLDGQDAGGRAADSSRRSTAWRAGCAGAARREASLRQGDRRILLAADGGRHRAAARRAQHLDAASAVSRRDLSLVEGPRRDPQADDHARSARHRALRRQSGAADPDGEKDHPPAASTATRGRVRVLGAGRSEGARRHRLSEPARSKVRSVSRSTSSPMSPTRSAGSARRRSTC